MKLYEKHERWSMVTSWMGRYKKYTVEITETREGISSGPVTGYWFLCRRICDDKCYNSLWDKKLYRTCDAAEAAVIKYIDEETEKGE